VKECPRCADVSAWTGEHCNACGYQAWSASRDSRQWPAYKRVQKLFSAVLVDEAQLAKSKNTLRGRAIRALKPKGKLILTGTLMKGFAHDIFWNVARLLGFDNPLFPYAYRGGTKRFLSEFSTIQFVSRQFEDTLSEGRGKVLPEVSNLNRFWRLMASFSVRRRKDDIFVLPPKQRQIVLLNMDSAHRSLYAGYAEWAQNAIAKALRESDGNPNMGIISGALWKLRYAATCPVARDYLDRGVLEAETWNKLEKIRELVRAAADRGEKTIIFSGLRVMVAAIVRHLRQHGLAVLPITAEVQAKKRFGLIQKFSRSPDVCHRRIAQLSQPRLHDHRGQPRHPRRSRVLTRSHRAGGRSCPPARPDQTRPHLLPSLARHDRPSHARDPRAEGAGHSARHRRQGSLRRCRRDPQARHG
jgi:hypothetical protein